jgi:hypothetical protein
LVIRGGLFEKRYKPFKFDIPPFIIHRDRLAHLWCQNRSKTGQITGEVIAMRKLRYDK